MRRADVFPAADAPEQLSVKLDSLSDAPAKLAAKPKSSSGFEPWSRLR